MNQDEIKELCHNMIKELDDESVLYHSDTYLGEDYSDGLCHYKYISKEKINGKWRYYYKHKEAARGSAIYEKVEGDPNDKYGVYVNNGPLGKKVGVVGKGTSLLTKTWKSTSDGKNITYTQIGKIEQGADAVKKALGEIGKRTISSFRNAINKGKQFLSSLWGKIYKKEASATFKTIKIEKTK